MFLFQIIAGENLQVISDDMSTISHVFGLAVLENVLLYSDWDTNSVSMMDMGSEFRTSLVSNLTRPTAIVLYQPDKFAGKYRNDPSIFGRKVSANIVDSDQTAPETV